VTESPGPASLHIYAMERALSDDAGFAEFEAAHAALLGASAAKTLYVVLGPIGAGKSTAGARLAEALGCAHVDGDTLLGAEARLFGRERAPATHYAVAAELARADRCVLSCGGGVLYGRGAGSDDGPGDFRSTLEGALSSPDRGVSVETVAVVPRHPGLSLADIFATHDAAGVAARRAREGRLGWAGADDPEFAARITRQSQGNLEFARAALAACDARGHWDYDPEGRPPAGAPEVPAPAGPSAPDGGAPCEVRVRQVRCAALWRGVGAADGGAGAADGEARPQVRHVTVVHSEEPFPVDPRALASMPRMTVRGRVVSMKRQGQHLSCFAPDLATLEAPGGGARPGEVPEAWRHALGGDEARVADFLERWHVTLSSGTLPSSSLIEVARAYRGGQERAIEAGPAAEVELLGMFGVL